MNAKGRQPGARRTKAAAARRAAAEATQAAEGRRAIPEASAFEPAGRPSDVFGSELPLRADGAPGGAVRRRDMFALLVLHLIESAGEGASYGNQLIERIHALTHGAVNLNPNTIYPLLRELEQRGLVSGRWEHPEKRSRRLYSITAKGREEHERLRSAMEPFLDSIIETITLIKREVYGGGDRGRPRPADRAA